MAEIILFHHIQGLTDGVRAVAEDLRAAGHTVHAPDLFYGRTFASIEEGFAFAQQAGFEDLTARGLAAAEELPSDIVPIGLSFGVGIAQQITQTRPGVRGAVLLHSCFPVAAFSESWPQGVPVQIHGMEGDEFFAEDLPAAKDLVAHAEDAELFVYPGEGHLFTDPSLAAYDAEAAALVRKRVLAFLERLS